MNYKYQSTQGKQRNVLKKPSIWYYKNVADQKSICKKLKRKFHFDILSLYEKSLLVDVKLIAAEGHIVYSHHQIIAGRYPSIWYFLVEIRKAQLVGPHQKDCKFWNINLPSVNYHCLESFIRSIYSEVIDKSQASLLLTLLEQYLNALQRRTVPKEPQLFLEKLNHHEEKQIQQMLFLQLKKGEISEAKGNLRILSRPTKPKVSKLPVPLADNPKGRPRTESTGFSPSIVLKINGAVTSSNTARVLTLNKDFAENLLLTDNSRMSCEEILAKEKVEEVVSTKKSLDTLVSVETNQDVEYLPEPELNSVEKTKHETIKHETIKHETIKHETNKPETNKAEAIKHEAIKPETIKPEAVRVKTNVETKKNRKSLPECGIKSPSCRKFNRSLSERKSKSSDEMKFLFTQSLHEEDSSDNDFAGLHETSSLEVELPSSQDDHSFSADSGQSEENFEASGSAIEEPSSNYTEENNESRLYFMDVSEVHVESTERKTPVNPHKPLVRTRTFDLIEPTCAAINLDANESGVEVDAHVEDSSPTNVTFENDDSTKLKELERLKGSLIFEHNLQTFSNIPPTTIIESGPIYDGGILIHPNRLPDALIGTPSVSSSLPSTSCFSQLMSVTGLEMNNIPESNRVLPPPLLPQLSQEEALELHLEIAKRGPGSRSPSPDSLSMDLSPRIPHLGGNKEKSCVEEKEKDEKENFSLISAFQEKKALQSNSGIESPKVIRNSENVPIISGGLTLRNLELESKTVDINQRLSNGPVAKDIDSIPVISGYGTVVELSPEKEKEISAADLAAKKKEAENQSMFSMFIDLDKVEASSTQIQKTEENKSQASKGGMFMFIEAESKPSPKLKRKQKPDIESSKSNKAVDKHLKSIVKETCKGTGSVKHPELNSILKPEKTDVPRVEKEICKNDQSKDSEKKGFFVFIEAENLSKTSSPKLRRRPPPVRPPSKHKQATNVMSKSAPSDSLMFPKDELSIKTPAPDTPSKFMTKSVIDREEFMAQLPTRRNVSLNDKINESSSKIPRPIKDFKEKLLASQRELEVLQKLKNFNQNENPKRTKSSEQTKSLEASTTSEAITSLSSSFNDAPCSSILHDLEDASEISDVSSLLSSLERSNEKSDQEGKGNHAVLGDDLLKMFLNEVNTDVTIQIGEKKIRAHKCILASRCVYFAAMLSGHWVESAGNVIKLQGFSYEVVMEALKHIYSGSGTVPPGIKVAELAAISDMLALDGLKEVVAQYYKANLCHYFHKPCPDCIHGVLEVLPIAGAYCIDELYHKCLRWISKNFEIIFPTKNFANLPMELQERCLKQIMDDLCVSNVVDAAMGTERVLSTLPNVKWAQTSLDLAAQLMESVTSFISTHLSSVLVSQKFLSLGKDSGWSVDSLEDTLKMACDMIRPDEAVLSHIELTKLIEFRHEESDYSEVFMSMCDRILNLVEKFIIHNANRVAVCRKWPLLPAETQKRIKDAALIVLEFSKPMGHKTKLSTIASSTANNKNNNRSRGSSLEPVTRARASSMSDHRLSRSSSTAVVLPCQARKFQTPPPTRASTLRAQARQTAIQRSHSARTVGDKIKKLQPMNYNASSDADDSSSHSVKSVSKMEGPQSRARTPGSVQLSGSSRSSTPVFVDKKRNSLIPFKVKTTEANVFHQHSKESFSLSFDEKSTSSKLIHSQHDALNGTSNFPNVEDKTQPDVRYRNKSHLPALGKLPRSSTKETHKQTKASDDREIQLTSSAEGIVPPVVGLGSRSNTFCLDDGPRSARSSKEIPLEDH